MSDPRPADLVADDEAAALAAARDLITANASGALVEFILGELAGEQTWSRERILGRLGRIPGVEALLPHFTAALADPSHPDRRNSARSSLAALAAPGSDGSEAGLNSLRSLLAASPDSDVRLLAAVALGEAGNARARTSLEEALSDADTNVAAAAAESLGMLGDRRSIAALSRATQEGEFWIRVTAVVALGRLGDRRALSALFEAARDPLLAAPAATAIGLVGSPEALDGLAEPLRGEGEARQAAVEAVAAIFGRNPDLEVPDWLRHGVRGDDEALVERLLDDFDEHAARILGISATPAATRALFEALTDPDLSPLASIGLELLPAEVRGREAIARIESAPPEARAAFLEILPPLAGPEQVARVAEHLGDDLAEVRNAAASALARSEDEAVAEALDRSMEDPARRVGVAQTYLRLEDPACAPLLRLLRDEDAAVRRVAVAALGRCRGIGVEPLREALAAETDSRVRQALVGALGEAEDAAAVPPLVEALRDPEPSVRFAAVRALGRTGTDGALEPLLRALDDPLAEIRIAALQAMGELGDSRAAPVVEDHLEGTSRDVRRTAALALGRLSAGRTVKQLSAALDDGDREVRLTAIETLRRLGGVGALALLEARADTEIDPAVRRSVTRAVLDLREEAAAGST